MIVHTDLQTDQQLHNRIDNLGQILRYFTW